MHAFVTGNLLAVTSMLAAALGLPSQASPPPPPAAERGPAAFLFEYRLKPGLADAFDEGYRRHLGWHKQAGDPLSWYAWYVATGERAGVFIDGTFGISFKAFDNRIDPAGDVNDFDRTVAPLADPLSRSVYRVRPELSTGQSLERTSPSPAVEVTRIMGKPGATEQLEQAFAALRSAAARTSLSPMFTCYELVSGGEQPQYLVMMPRSGWRDYDASPRSGLDRLVERLDPADRGTFQRSFAEQVRGHSVETWTYRSDLSLIASR